MTDTRLRTAARHAALDGSPEARAAWLRERLRSQDTPCVGCGGKGVQPRYAWEPSASHANDPLGPCPSCAGTGLTLRPRVELAAYCGDEGARAALGDEAAWQHLWPPISGGGDPCALCKFRLFHRPECPDVTPAELARGLSRWGPSVMVRAAVAAARAALPKWSSEAASNDTIPYYGSAAADNAAFAEQVNFRAREPLRAIEAAEAWLACPCEEHRSRWYDFWRDAAWEPEWPARRWIPCPLETDHSARVGVAARLAGEQPVREAVQRTLIAWALA